MPTSPTLRPTCSISTAPCTPAGRPFPAPRAAFERLRAGAIPFRLVTNTTSRSRRDARRAAGGVRLRGGSGELVHRDARRGRAGPASAGHRRVAPFLPGVALEDLDRARSRGRHLRRQPPAGWRADAVMVGDLGERWTYALLQEAFEHLMAGAALIALSRDRYWLRDGRLALDAGPFVAALEYAAGRPAAMAGKPSPAFFDAAVAEPRRRSRPGRSPWSATISGPTCRAPSGPGLQRWLVRTGKFREDVLAGQRDRARPHPRERGPTGIGLTSTVYLSPPPCSWSAFASRPCPASLWASALSSRLAAQTAADSGTGGHAAASSVVRAVELRSAGHLRSR